MTAALVEDDPDMTLVSGTARVRGVTAFEAVERTSTRTWTTSTRG